MHASIWHFGGDPDDLLRGYDAMLAELPPFELQLCLRAPGGMLIVSGVTRDEASAVTAAFQTAGATIDTRLVEDSDNEWVGLRFTTV